MEKFFMKIGSPKEIFKGENRECITEIGAD